MKLTRLISILCEVGGCQSSPPPAPAPTAAKERTGSATASGSAAAADPKPAALPADLAALAPGGKLLAGPFNWPKGGKSALVQTDDIPSAVVWKSPAGSGTAVLPRVGGRVIQRDLNKDGVPELVVF